MKGNCHRYATTQVRDLLLYFVGTLALADAVVVSVSWWLWAGLVSAVSAEPGFGRHE